MGGSPVPHPHRILPGLQEPDGSRWSQPPLSRVLSVRHQAGFRPTALEHNTLGGMSSASHPRNQFLRSLRAGPGWCVPALAGPLSLHSATCQPLPSCLQVKSPQPLPLTRKFPQKDGREAPSHIQPSGSLHYQNTGCIQKHLEKISQLSVSLDERVISAEKTKQNLNKSMINFKENKTLHKQENKISLHRVAQL